MQVIAKLMIGVSNMFVKYIFGSPCKGHIYRFDSPMTDREIISFGQSGIIDENDFTYEQVEGFEASIKTGSLTQQEVKE